MGRPMTVHELSDAQLEKHARTVHAEQVRRADLKEAETKEALRLRFSCLSGGKFKRMKDKG